MQKRHAGVVFCALLFVCVRIVTAMYIFPVPPFVEIDALASQWPHEDAPEANESMATASSRKGAVVIAGITRTPLFEPIWCGAS